MSWATKAVITERGVAIPPISDCPKCGMVGGLSRSKPKFAYCEWTDKDGDPIQGPGYLTWACTWCGYRVESAALDEERP